MWARRISSGGPECPTPRHVVEALLARLIEQAGNSSWAHFEVISERGWSRDLLFLKEPCVEVAYEDEHSLLLIPEIRNQARELMPDIPERWPRKRKGLWSVSISDRE